MLSRAHLSIAALCVSSTLALSVGVVASNAAAAPSTDLKSLVLTGPEAASAVGYNGGLTASSAECGVDDDVQYCGTLLTSTANDRAALPEIIAVAKAPTRKLARDFVRASAESTGGTVVSSEGGVTIIYLRDGSTQTGYGLQRVGTWVTAATCSATSGTRSAVIRCAEQLLEAQSEKAGLI